MKNQYKLDENKMKSDSLPTSWKIILRSYQYVNLVIDNVGYHIGKLSYWVRLLLYLPIDNDTFSSINSLYCTNKLGTAVLFVCTFATWWFGQNCEYARHD